MVKCPFDPSAGFATVDARNEYLKYFRDGSISSFKGDEVDVDNDNHCNNDDMVVSESLQADPDTTQPLYFWQLFSLIGHGVAMQILTLFYEGIFADSKNPWFRDVFVNIGDIRHHALRQANYWNDAMGGGPSYYGVHNRLDFHHFRHAMSLMNARGSKRWMYHMRAALIAVDLSEYQDPRIKPCVMAFLKIKMKAYSCEFEFEFEFDETDFNLEEKQKE
jgi:truncated hemoglobin YjbI